MKKLPKIQTNIIISFSFVTLNSTPPKLKVRSLIVGKDYKQIK
jgi:hypothetical protein